MILVRETQDCQSMCETVEEKEQWSTRPIYATTPLSMDTRDHTESLVPESSHRLALA